MSTLNSKTVGVYFAIDLILAQHGSAEELSADQESDNDAVMSDSGTNDAVMSDSWSAPDSSQ